MSHKRDGVTPPTASMCQDGGVERPFERRRRWVCSWRGCVRCDGLQSTSDPPEAAHFCGSAALYRGNRTLLRAEAQQSKIMFSAWATFILVGIAAVFASHAENEGRTAAAPLLRAKPDLTPARQPACCHIGGTEAAARYRAAANSPKRGRRPLHRTFECCDRTCTPPAGCTRSALDRR
jgi:hypothetical protein